MLPLRPVKPWIIVALAWCIPAALGAINALGQLAVWGGPGGWAEVLFTAVDWLMYGALTPVIFSLSARWPVTRARSRERLLEHLVAALLLCVVWASAGTVLRVLLFPAMWTKGGALSHWYLAWLLGTLPVGVSVYAAMVGVEHAIRLFAEARQRERQLARVAEQLGAARLSALQAQLNPHFLFNSLNTVAVLVRDADTRRATDVIEQLSRVLRRTLSRTEASHVHLREELELVQAYLAVEQARFSDRLRVVMDVDPSLLSAAVPGFALQHLVENAVRHGISRRTSAGIVRIAAARVGDMLDLTVADDGAGVAGDIDRTGRGLANTRERLRTLYGNSASLHVSRQEPYGTIAHLRIPYQEWIAGSYAGA